MGTLMNFADFSMADDVIVRSKKLNSVLLAYDMTYNAVSQAEVITMQLKLKKRSL